MQKHTGLRVFISSYTILSLLFILSKILNLINLEWGWVVVIVLLPLLAIASFVWLVALL